MTSLKKAKSVEFPLSAGNAAASVCFSSFFQSLGQRRPRVLLPGTSDPPGSPSERVCSQPDTLSPPETPGPGNAPSRAPGASLHPPRPSLPAGLPSPRSVFGGSPSSRPWPACSPGCRRQAASGPAGPSPSGRRRWGGTADRTRPPGGAGSRPRTFECPEPSHRPARCGGAPPFDSSRRPDPARSSHHYRTAGAELSLQRSRGVTGLNLMTFSVFGWGQFHHNSRLLLAPCRCCAAHFHNDITAPANTAICHHSNCMWHTQRQNRRNCSFTVSVF